MSPSCVPFLCLSPLPLSCLCGLPHHARPRPPSWKESEQLLGVTSCWHRKLFALTAPHPLPWAHRLSWMLLLKLLLLAVYAYRPLRGE